MALATSVAAAGRPKGNAVEASISGSTGSSTRSIDVSTAPGCTAFTRMPNCARSRANALLHRIRGGLTTEERASDIDREHLVVGLLGHVEEVLPTEDPRTVDHRGETAQRLRDSHSTGEIRGLGHVCLDELRGGSGVLHDVHGGATAFTWFVADIRDDHGLSAV